MVEELQALSAFNAPDGTVWEYIFILGPNNYDETLFLVLPERQTTYTGITLTVFRRYLDLLTGSYEWFAEGSALNRRSTRLG